MTPAFAAAGPTAYWYLTRGTGIAALLGLTASILLGVLGSQRFAGGRRWPRFAIDTLHRDVSLLVIVLLVLHIVTSVLDGFAPIALTDAVLPFLSRYRPIWLGLGALAFDVLLALVVTSLVRRRLGYRSWRAIHWLAYASWPLAVLHGLGTGSDTKVGWVLAVTAACVAAVLVAILVRVARSGPPFARWRAPASAVAIASCIGVAIFTAVGPLQRGWARRAGTPAALLAQAATPTAPAATSATNPATSAQAGATGPSNSAPPSRTARTPGLKAPFVARLSGSVTQTDAGNGELIDLSLRLSGNTHGQLRIRLAGAPLPGGGLTMTGSQVDLVAGGLPSVLEGQVQSLDGSRIVARVSNPSNGAMLLTLSLDVDSETGQVSGRLHAEQAT